MNNENLLAAIDIGSNSFRLEIGHIIHSQLHRVEYLKETVRLGSGLSDTGLLSQESMQRGWDCLSRFAERIKEFKQSNVRAVATQTLREAVNSAQFIEKAELILGFGIEVISGDTEAMLIFQGVTHVLPESPERRFIIDIGGRSTELITGSGLNPSALHSYPLGSVNWSMTYFPNNKITARNFYSADIAAKAILANITANYKAETWDTAYGSSGTISAISTILIAAGKGHGEITRDGLDWIVSEMTRYGSTQKLKLPELREDRKAVLAGGISILSAVFDLCQIQTLHPTQGALRHGVLFELSERELLHSNVQDQSINRLCKLFHIDLAQSQRVEHIAAQLYASLIATINTTGSSAEAPTTLRYATKLHEIGRAITHKSDHKHGAYIIENANVLGFSSSTIKFIANLVLGQRGKLKKLSYFLEDEGFVVQLLALRLSIIMCHARAAPDTTDISLIRTTAKKPHFLLKLPALWASQYPQSTRLLEQESLAWDKTQYTFEINIS